MDIVAWHNFRSFRGSTYYRQIGISPFCFSSSPKRIVLQIFLQKGTINPNVKYPHFERGDADQRVFYCCNCLPFLALTTFEK